jgi:hypothetical protein
VLEGKFQMKEEPRRIEKKYSSRTVFLRSRSTLNIFLRLMSKILKEDKYENTFIRSS